MRKSKEAMEPKLPIREASRTGPSVAEGSQGSTASVSTGLSREELLSYVELVLWTRFSERLWKLVAVVLSLATVVGLLGVPYYIRSEVSQRLQQQEKNFAARADEVASRSKLLAILRVRYESQLYVFEGDVLRLISALDQMDHPQMGEAWRLKTRLQELLAFRDFPGSSEEWRRTYSAILPIESLQNLLDKEALPPPRMVYAPDPRMGVTSFASVPHPVRRGTYASCLKDLQFKLVVLFALRQTIETVEGRLLRAGATSSLEENVTVARVTAMEEAEVRNPFAQQLSAVANRLLKPQEQGEFAEQQSLYLQGYQATYTAPTPSLTPSPSPNEAMSSGRH